MPLRGGHAHAPSAEVLGEYNHLTPIPRENLDAALQGVVLVLES